MGEMSTRSASVELTKTCSDVIVRMVTRAPEVEIKSFPVCSARSCVFVSFKIYFVTKWTKDKMESICVVQ